MYLFFSCTIMVWYGLLASCNVRSSTMEPGAIKRWTTTRSRDQCENEAVSRARLYSLRPLALYILFVLRGYLWWISMMFVYTGVISEYNIIIHYSSVKKYMVRLFKNIDIGDLLTAIRRCSRLLRCCRCSMSDVYIGRTLPILGQNLWIWPTPLHTGWKNLPSMCDDAMTSLTTSMTSLWCHLELNLGTKDCRSLKPW